MVNDSNGKQVLKKGYWEVLSKAPPYACVKVECTY